MSDLVKRLRVAPHFYRRGEGIAQGLQPDPICQEAADRIEALERQVVALQQNIEELKANQADVQL
jgi:hypothetical protein